MATWEFLWRKVMTGGPHYETEGGDGKGLSSRSGVSLCSHRKYQESRARESSMHLLVLGRPFVIMGGCVSELRCCHQLIAFVHIYELGKKMCEWWEKVVQQVPGAVQGLEPSQWTRQACPSPRNLPAPPGLCSRRWTSDLPGSLLSPLPEQLVSD